MQQLECSRFFNFSERYRLEVFGEFVNLFNINSIVQFNNVTVATTANGDLIGPLPDFKARKPINRCQGSFVCLIILLLKLSRCLS
jgi:hypothetical protein